MSALELKQRFETNLGDFEGAFNRAVACVPLTIAWVTAEQAMNPTFAAARLLAGSKLALMEGAASWATGLNRGAAGSLRTLIENLFAWLYFKDHPVEFAAVERKDADLLLPKAVLTYMKSIDRGFETAYGLIKDKKTRPADYYYSDISEYVHAHPSHVLPGKASWELAVTVPPDSGFLTISKHADEFISDAFSTHYRASWGIVPQKVKDNLSARLGDKVAKFIAVP
jgi:hypothetical protein